MLQLRKLLRRRLVSPGGSFASDSFYSLEQMRKALESERLRSDRGNSDFSLLTLTYPSACDAVELAMMARIFRRRLRLTDQAGLLAPRRIGIVLPLTSSEGAWTLADDIVHLIPSEAREPECDVYTYSGRIGPEDDEIRGSGLEPGKTNAFKPPGTRTNGVASGLGAMQAHPSAKSMQPLFVQPLPAWKRALDVIGAAIALGLTSPIILLVAVAIKLSSRGPVFYLQERDGHMGMKFWICKFRTMVVNADELKSQLRSLSEQDGPAFKLKNDPRVTVVGRLLRRTCLDELPQLFNVLKGDMTLVGPRPMCSREARHCTPWQRRRLDVTPGITCTWQVEGGTKTTFAEWMRMDLRYAGSRSMWSDLRLLAMTIPSIIRRDGVY
jgi:lipopolysaccharide/colanic/teichoic acid biosynthesis glycosyltransferase